MQEIIGTLNGLIWSKALIYLCLGAGLFFSIITRFMQVRHFMEMLRLLFKPNTSPEGISSFQALAVALSGRVGMGNIAGVAAAIGFGGPGAVFWMWVVAFLGASTAYVESTLAQIYKENDNGQYRGGPAYYFEKFFKGSTGKVYGAIFAIASVVACGIFLPGVQANGVANAVVSVVGEGSLVQTSFGDVGMNKLIALLFILVILGMIIFGGIKRIANVTEIVVPFMALGYILMALLIVFMNIGKLPEIIGMIVSDAFSAQAGFGAAIGWGVKRGVYSNEAGQGTGPHPAAAAEVEHPAQQGFVQAFSVYVDTLFVCSATAFMILITGQYNIQGTLEKGQFLVQNVAAATEINGPAFTQMAVSSVFGSFGNVFTGFSIFFFAFTTILAYYYIAETNMAYLTRKVKENTFFIVFVKVILMASVAYGAVNSAGYVWEIGDVGVGLMAWLNIVGIIVIFLKSKPTIHALKDYEEQKKAGVKHYTFDPKKMGIEGATFWEERLAKRENQSQD
ncbi:alanine/glycine:cation symporter family protein [Alysiella filiformis]|uniref:Alanine or glycine:cation symporter, AGCS family n=1 Tax=Alysiella filiformis DSM 16848 TaxID=1120981 RepID=A0A286E5K2_9NEIS|nr:alanine/glycine:cation symporter family protein [Alysiella filiformis]QMT30365.1 alanine:cation symporter family protein [Alysiella filiformis]UBQ56656.1 alanine:cation symporter family protein [Alysiella filiformis DSM 16848]SOD66187.1 alanine or glycine:cation symporter, AGCS family [Alysiella filiformis DSM 16848]